MEIVALLHREVEKVGWFIFGIGLVVGAFIGVGVMSILIVASKADDDLYKEDQFK